MRKLKKKASIEDIFYAVIVFFILGITILLGWVFYGKLNTEFQNNPDFSTSGKTIIQDNADKYVDIFDGIFLVVVVVLAFGILFLAYNIQTTPIFYPIILILFVALVFVSAVVGNTYYDIASNPKISEYADDFTIMPFLFNHFVETMIAFGFLVAIVMYARIRE